MTPLVREGARSKVVRAWAGKAVVCIAGGPSLTQAELERIREARAADLVRVIAVNDAYLVAPWADAAYFADASWWRTQVKGLPRVWPWLQMTAAQVVEAHSAFSGQWVSIRHPDEIRDPRVHLLENGGVDGFEASPYGIRTGQNSGYQALHVAVHAGGSPVLLVAYDMRNQGRRTHWHNGHLSNSGDAALADFAKRFDTIERPLAELGVRVVNCTQGSRILAFPHESLETCLARLVPDPTAAALSA